MPIKISLNVLIIVIEFSDKNIITVRNDKEFCLQRGVSASVHSGIHPLGIHHPWADTPLQQTATGVDDMHPTGIHSCLNL